MEPESIATLLIVLLVGAGVIGGTVVIVRARPESARLEANPLVPRLTAEVHAGAEQVLIHLARSIQVATNRLGVGYGEVYIAGSADSTMRLASRSEIGRGFDAEIRVQRTRRSSIAEYYVLRLPADEAVLARVRDLDHEIARAVRSLDPAAKVRLLGRDVASGGETPADGERAGREPAA